MYRKTRLRSVCAFWWMGGRRKCIVFHCWSRSQGCNRFWSTFSVTFNKDESKHNDSSERPQNDTDNDTCRETTLIVVIFWIGGVGWNITASWGSCACRMNNKVNTLFDAHFRKKCLRINSLRHTLCATIAGIDICAVFLGKRSIELISNAPIAAHDSVT